MSQIIIDPQPQVREPEYDVSAYSVPVATSNKSNALSIAALVSAVVAVGLSCIPLFVSGVPMGLALGLTGAGLIVGMLSAGMGIVGLARAASKALGMTGLVVGLLALVWTIGGLACTVW